MDDDIGYCKMLNAAVFSNVGLVRKNNEDNYILGHCLNDESKDESSSYMCCDDGKWVQTNLGCYTLYY